MAPGINYVDYFEVGEWKGRRNYQCKLCPYSTVESTARILLHLSGHKLMPSVSQAYLKPAQPEPDISEADTSEEE